MGSTRRVHLLQGARSREDVSNTGVDMLISGRAYTAPGEGKWSVYGNLLVDL